MVTLQLHRRHGTDCIGGHRLFDRSYEQDENRRKWRKCACPIYASGTLGGKHQRVSTRQFTWEAAKRVAGAWAAANSFDITPMPPAFADTSMVVPSSITIDRASADFLSDCEARELADSTLRKYRTMVSQMSAYALKKGYSFLGQWTPQDVRDLRAGWADGIRAGAKKLERVRAFFEFCVTNGWIERNPAAQVKPPKGAGTPAHKSPFTDEEVQRILTVCDNLSDTVWTSGSRSGIWTGRDAKDFIHVMLYTGLRISDVAAFEIERLNRNDCFLFMHKTVRCPCPAAQFGGRTPARLRECAP